MKRDAIQSIGSVVSPIMTVPRDGNDQPDPVQLIPENEVADLRGDQCAAQIASVVERGQPACFGQSQTGLLLHERQQRCVKNGRRRKSAAS